MTTLLDLEKQLQELELRVKKHMKKYIIIILVLCISLAGMYWFFLTKKETTTITNFDECVKAGNPVAESYPPQCRAHNQTFVQDIGNELEQQDIIRVEEPRPNASISNPLTIKGEARGTWYFEGDFLITVEDEQGNTLGKAIATAQHDWMTEEFVPFSTALFFTYPFSPDSTMKPIPLTLVLEKNNPSALQENAEVLRIPVRFEKKPTRDIQLYYYNSKSDIEKSCSMQFIRPVSRTIPHTNTPIQDALNFLLKGQLTEEEKTQGFSTGFPPNGVELIGANLQEGILKLEFSDSQNFLSGGSCRVEILRAQIEKTAKQFPGVRQVQFIPEELLQP